MEALLTDPQGDDRGYERVPKTFLNHCGTAACIAGWANALWGPRRRSLGVDEAGYFLGLSSLQQERLFTPLYYWKVGRYTRTDAIAAIQSMLDSPDGDALPVWPSRAEAGQ